MVHVVGECFCFVAEVMRDGDAPIVAYLAHVLIGQGCAMLAQHWLLEQFHLHEFLLSLFCTIPQQIVSEWLGKSHGFVLCRGCVFRVRCGKCDTTSNDDCYVLYHISFWGRYGAWSVPRDGHT